MKKLFFSFVFLLAGTLAFASPREMSAQEAEILTLEAPDTGSESEFQVNPLFDCTIKASVTIIFNDGTSMTIKDANVTFKGISCGQLLKELISAN